MRLLNPAVSNYHLSDALVEIQMLRRVLGAGGRYCVTVHMPPPVWTILSTTYKSITPSIRKYTTIM